MMKKRFLLWLIPVLFIPAFLSSCNSNTNNVSISFSTDLALYDNSSFKINLSGVKADDKNDVKVISSNLGDFPENMIHISDYDSYNQCVLITREHNEEYTEEKNLYLTVWYKTTIINDFSIVVPLSTQISPYEYINDRTVSLTYRNTTSKILGTGWIMNKVDSTNPYEYYLATNFHVLAEMPTSQSMGQLGWDTTDDIQDTTCANLSGGGSYTRFSSWSFVTQPLYDTTTTSGYYNGIDMLILDVNFGSSPKEIMKEKLDKLNDIWENSGSVGERHINEYRNFVSNPTFNNLYIAGYPAISTTGIFQAHWDEYSTTTNFTRKNNFSNEISTTNSTLKSLNVTAPTFFKDSWDSYGAYPLKGGSSGSMVISRKLDGTFEILGIYWGGMVDNSNNPTIFQPSFQVFGNNPWKTFTNVTPDGFLPTNIPSDIYID